MSRPNFRRRPPRGPRVRMNGKIRAREVRVVGDDGKQLGVYPTNEAIDLARRKGLDLVEIASSANPPVCRIVDYGRYLYEVSKKKKEQRKTQAVNKIKEIQLRPNIDPHDFTFKANRAVDFLCEEMKVKVVLRFRGRELRHKELGFQAIKAFIEQVAPFGHADFEPRAAGRSIMVMISPLPKDRRAPHPRPGEKAVEVQHEDIRSIEEPMEGNASERLNNNTFGDIPAK